MTPVVFDEALARLGLCGDGPVRVGINAFTVSSAAVGASGDQVWVRVAPVLDGGPRGEVWMPTDAVEDAYRTLGDRVSMPRLLASTEWDAGEQPVRAWVFERLSGAAISPTPEITADPGLADGWWRDLRDAQDMVAESAAMEGRPTHMITMWIKNLTGEDVDSSEIDGPPHTTTSTGPTSLPTL